MKKKLLMFMMVFAVVTVLFMDKVFAANGPGGDYSEICFSNDDGYYYVYTSSEGIDNNVVPGATYDKGSNTLTINNVKGYSFFTENMGEDFKLNVVGDNEIKYITIREYDYPSDLRITGYGNLEVGKEKNTIFGIEVFGGKLVIDDSVNVSVDVLAEIDDWDDYVPTVLFTRNRIEKGTDSIVIKNGDKYDITSEPYCYGDDSPYPAIKLDSFDYENKFIVQKGDKKYLVEISHDSDENQDYYILYYGNIKEITYNNATLHFVDESGIGYNEDDWHIYNSIDEIKSLGYTVTNDDWEVYYATHRRFDLKYDENEENAYAVFHDFNDNRTVFDITDSKVTLDDGETYTYVVSNNTVNDNDLHHKLICDGYQHGVDLDSIRIKAKRYQVVEGDNQTYIIGGDGITFKINADYNLFSNGGKVYVDGKEITDYTSKEGSTVISLNKEFLQKLSTGNHTIRVVFNNEKYAEANFIVQEEKEEKAVSNPNTGDHIVHYILLLVISMVGFIGINIYKRKSK